MNFIKISLVFAIFNITLIQSNECSSLPVQEIKLIFSDGQEIPAVPLKILRRSMTLNDLFLDIKDTDEIPPERLEVYLTNVGSEIGKKIVELLASVAQSRLRREVVYLIEEKLNSYELQSEQVIDLLNAVDYLDIPILDKELVTFVMAKRLLNDDEFLRSMLLYLPGDLMADLLLYKEQTLNVPPESSNGQISMSADGNIIVMTGTSTYILNRYVDEIFNIGEFFSAFVSSDGNTILAMKFDTKVQEGPFYLFDNYGNLISKTESSFISVLAPSHSGNRIVAVSDFAVLLFDRNLHQVAMLDESYGPLMSEDGSTIVVNSNSTNRPLIFDKDGVQIAEIENSYTPRAINYDGTEILAVDFSHITQNVTNNIYVFGRDGKLISQIKGKFWIKSISMDGYGDRILATGYNSEKEALENIYVFDKSGNKILEIAGLYRFSVISLDGNIIMAIGYDNNVHIFDRSGKPISQIRTAPFKVNLFPSQGIPRVISADGNTIVVQGSNSYFYKIERISANKLKTIAQDIITELRSQLSPENLDILKSNLAGKLSDLKIKI